jgi:hypothetical protein
MQECFKCHIVKPISEFYAHPQMANGHLGKCKECSKRDTRDNYQDKKDQYKIYYTEREKTPLRKAWRFEQQRRQRKLNPVQYHCRIITSNAMSHGILVRKPCRVCGVMRAEAHHDDYYNPLRVDWLCPKHHRALHADRVLKEGEQNG